MSKKEKFKNWCKEHKYILIGGGLIATTCAGAILKLTIFKSDNSVDPKVIDLNDLGLLGKVLKVESVSGRELFSQFEGYKLSDLGKFGEDALKDAPDDITPDTGINGILLMFEKSKTE